MRHLHALALTAALSAGPAFAIDPRNCVGDAIDHPDCPRAELPVVPLPATAALLVLGMAALFRRTWR